ncbi:hypothetical protein [uncultured Psychroserpens sp.]|uniref:hypothetical protein n=1 Tax=uncultured Psychroserpens sp. TaxID=255436 RepID=UPI002617CDAB|nr:hypothetical protein [uncultured Psychroserpens sp.]
MQFNNYIKTKLPFFVALSFTFVLASCGSYQYVGYDSDGIYNDENEVVEEVEAPTETTSNSSYYKNYFAEKSNQYSDIPTDEEVIFTDIDSYSSDYIEDEQLNGAQTGYAGWGQANENVTINIIDNGWNNWGWNNPWLWNNWGWGWNNWGWNAGWGWGWNNWGWNAGWGWGGWNAGFGWGGFGWNNGFWCPPGYYNRGYRGVAFNAGRRGYGNVYASRNAINRRSYTSNGIRRNSTSFNNGRSRATRNTTTRRINNRGTTTRRNTSVRTTRPNSTTRRMNTTTTRRNNTRARTNSSSSSVRRSSPSVRRSSGTSRSSSMRGSRGSSSRSSGMRSSSGRRR